MQWLDLSTSGRKVKVIKYGMGWDRLVGTGVATALKIVRWPSGRKVKVIKHKFPHVSASQEVLILESARKSSSVCSVQRKQ